MDIDALELRGLDRTTVLALSVRSDRRGLIRRDPSTCVTALTARVEQFRRWLRVRDLNPQQPSTDVAASPRADKFAARRECRLLAPSRPAEQPRKCLLPKVDRTYSARANSGHLEGGYKVDGPTPSCRGTRRRDSNPRSQPLQGCEPSMDGACGACLLSDGYKDGGTAGDRRKSLKRLARPERLELPTPRFVVWCSIQLSYGRSPAQPAARR